MRRSPSSAQATSGLGLHKRCIRKRCGSWTSSGRVGAVAQAMPRHTARPSLTLGCSRECRGGGPIGPCSRVGDGGLTAPHPARIPPRPVRALSGHCPGTVRIRTTAGHLWGRAVGPVAEARGPRHACERLTDLRCAAARREGGTGLAEGLLVYAVSHPAPSPASAIPDPVRHRERLWLWAFDRHLRLLRPPSSWLGRRSSLEVPIRALLDASRGAAGVVLVHTHPVGTVVASALDLRSTARLSALLAGRGVELLDHLIVGPRGHWSWAVAGGAQPPTMRPRPSTMRSNAW